MDHPSNSKKIKKNRGVIPKEEVKPLNIQTYKAKDKTSLGKLASSVFNEVDSKKFIDFFIYKVIGPNIKTGLHNIGMSVLDYIFLDDTKSVAKTATTSIMQAWTDKNAGNTNYTKYSKQNNVVSRVNNISQDTYRIINIEFINKGAAELLLETLKDNLNRYDFVSVATFYQLANCPDVMPKPIDFKWGWSNLDDAYTHRLSSGRFCIVFPVAIPID